MEHFPQARGHRAQRWPCDAGRQFDRTQPLIHKLAREVDVSSILEGHDYLGEPKLGDGTKLVQVGHAANLLLYGKCYLLLYLVGCKRGCNRVNWDLDGSGIGKCVNI